MFAGGCCPHASSGSVERRLMCRADRNRTIQL
jgi:hypothetical protein